ncbi:MAG: squalene/phytoene synthase family protein [Vulcanimicrobiaceae bacterium]
MFQANEAFSKEPRGAAADSSGQMTYAASGSTATDREATLAFGREIIGRVSRTFALGIRALSGDLGQAVLVGYLLCRIADTVEDDGECPAPRRQELLSRFLACFDDRSVAPAFAREAVVIQGSAAHRELLAQTVRVFALFDLLSPASAAIVERWTRELTGGMSEFVGRYPAGIRIQTFAEYRRYCYFVAGTIGHLLTELWRVHVPSISDRAFGALLARCEAFGEALQTVNILKDIAWDAEHENATYIPEELLRECGSSQATILTRALLRQNKAALEPLIGLAKSDLQASAEYMTRLPKGSPRIRFFCILPLLLAAATLREIERSSAMLEPGGAVKISRREVRLLVVAATLGTWSNHLARWVMARVGPPRRGLAATALSDSPRTLTAAP